jgi:hypothetical protein
MPWQSDKSAPVERPSIHSTHEITQAKSKREGRVINLVVAPADGTGLGILHNIELLQPRIGAVKVLVTFVNQELLDRILETGEIVGLSPCDDEPLIVLTVTGELKIAIKHTLPAN